MSGPFMRLQARCLLAARGRLAEARERVEVTHEGRLDGSRSSLARCQFNVKKMVSLRDWYDPAVRLAA